MTPLQTTVVALVRQNMADPKVRGGSGWLRASDVMAICQIESGWNPTIHSTDGLGSIGLMQCLATTAQSMGVSGPQSEPANSVLAGMRYLSACRAILTHWYDDEPALKDIIEAYNEGPGNVERGRLDNHYWNAFSVAQAQWAYVDTEIS